MPHAKRGRKKAHHIDSRTDLPVIGLARLSDGKRWRVIATGFRFTEPDEAKAIAYYRRLTGTEEQTDAQRRMMERPNPLAPTLDEMIAIVGREILSRPQYVAKVSGIEQIGYLLDLKPPVPLPTLDDLRQFWIDRAKCSPGQIAKVRRAFDDFREVTGITDLRAITRAAVDGYELAIAKRGDSGKQQFHLIWGVRRVLRFYAKRKAEGEAAEALRDALQALDSLEVELPQKTIDPKPIERADFHKLLAVADAQDKAMLLLGLNGAFYLGELIALEWSDVTKDNCIVTNRKKTGKCVRACVLWQETIDALAQLPRKGDAIFMGGNGKPIQISGMQRRWQRLALKAGLATARPGACNKTIINCDVTAAQLRDGAYTAAGAADISAQMCKLLVGHSCGLTDHYVKRSPQMVKPATDVVYAHYFG